MEQKELIKHIGHVTLAIRASGLESALESFTAILSQLPIELISAGHEEIEDALRPEDGHIAQTIINEFLAMRTRKDN